MKPDEFAVRMQQLADRGHFAESQAKAAGLQAMARTKVYGHQIYGNYTTVRVSGPRARTVARSLTRRASVAVVRALRGAFK